MKWRRFFYQPVLPLGEDGKRITGGKQHIEKSRQAAVEGMVLLKNEKKCLPIGRGQKVALFGKATVDYVKGGGGSGDVTVAYVRNFYEGMKIKEKEGKVALFHELGEFYEKEVQAQYQAGYEPGMTKEPEVPQSLLKKASSFTNTAIISICRFSGEGWDRKASTKRNGAMSDDEISQATRQAELYPNGDFYLSPEESKMIENVKSHFSNVIVLLNTGGVMDTSWFKDCEQIQSVLLTWQAGMEGGLASADLVCGDQCPSGKLTDTFASRLEDYPSTDHFHASDNSVEYEEDIFVGYRYFETIPGADRLVNYEFGYGLSYTKFLLDEQEAKQEDNEIVVKVRVTNTGDYEGKEVLQVYCEAPQGKLGKAKRQLVAFYKTRTLKIGESQLVVMRFPIENLASYDDQGCIQKSAWVLEQGEYTFYVGTSVRRIKQLDYSYHLAKDTIVKQCSSLVSPHKLSKRMKADGSFENCQTDEYQVLESQLPRQPHDELEGVAPESRFAERYYVFGNRVEKNIKLQDVVDGNATLEEFLDQLCLIDLAYLLGGQVCTGVANTFGIGNLLRFGIPNVMTADGPAGLRIAPECGVNTTAWPCATLLACTFNPELVEEIGVAAAKELKENNMGIWLAPAVNLHRSPLCGRNFEYYSEDPFLSGKMGSAMVKGIQSQNIAATVKHFACNNKETYRKDSDSILSERALRELYLKSFEIIVKESNPWCIMTSYNIVNGIRASENKELIQGILREDWNYEGLVMSDWWTHGEHYLETKAGNDVKMGNGYPERLVEAFEMGAISENEIKECVNRVLQMIMKLD